MCRRSRLIGGGDIRIIARHQAADPADGRGMAADGSVTIFFTSDQHFGHGGARGLFRRPFATTAEMDEAMVVRWNARIGPADEIWHLGDFAVRQPPARLAALLGRLRGIKHLIAGNNDGEATRGMPQWRTVAEYRELVVADRRLVLCHYPLRSWRDQTKGAIDLHGHSHGRLAPLARQLDIGVDTWGFGPVSLDEVIAAASGRTRRRPADGAAGP